MGNALLQSSDYHYVMNKVWSAINKMHHKMWRYNLATMEAREVAITISGKLKVN